MISWPKRCQNVPLTSSPFCTATGDNGLSMKKHMVSATDRAKAAERLRDARIKAGFETAKSASSFYGWNEYTYRSNENGNKPYGKALARAYATAFKTTVGYLLYGELGFTPIIHDDEFDLMEKYRSLDPVKQRLVRELVDSLLK